MFCFSSMKNIILPLGIAQIVKLLSEKYLRSKAFETEWRNARVREKVWKRWKYAERDSEGWREEECCIRQFGAESTPAIRIPLQSPWNDHRDRAKKLLRSCCSQISCCAVDAHYSAVALFLTISVVALSVVTLSWNQKTWFLLKKNI